jgi:hypothetical protein
MAGWEQLGNVLGGGIDRAGAFEQGRLRSAQTESALGLARQRQLENISLDTKNRARARTEESLIANGSAPTEAAMLADIMLGETGADFAAGTQGMGRLQEQGFRDTLANPEAPLGDQFAAGQGVQGKVLPRYDITGQTAEDLFNRDAPLAPTPVGQADIATEQARQNLLGVQTAAGGFSPGSRPPKDPRFDGAPSGWMVDPADPTGARLIPRPGGPSDITSPRNLGANLTAQLGRVLNAGGNTALDLASLVSMPTGATGGWLGKSGKDGILTTTRNALANGLNPEEVQRYTSVWDTLGEQLATIERMGVRGSQGLSQRFDGLGLTPTDTVYTKMQKLSQMRQTVETGMSTILALNPPPHMAERAQLILNEVARSIPFTPRDVIVLENSKDPQMTLATLLKSKGADFKNLNKQGIVNPIAPGAAPGAAPAQVERWERGPDGKLQRVGGQ